LSRGTLTRSEEETFTIVKNFSQKKKSLFARTGKFDFRKTQEAGA